MPRKLIDLTGKTFGMWTVLSHSHKDERKAHFWLCRCSCPKQTEKIVKGSSLTMGQSTNCGCDRLQKIIASKTKHGHYTGDKASKTYSSWSAMKGRCLNPEDKDYSHYGGRGITIHEPWINSFETFLADMGECPPNLTLDRISVNGNYTPGNCRWTDMTTQNRNKRKSLLITYRGETKHLKEWCEILNLPYSRIVQRISNHGYTPEEAFELPSHREGRPRRKK